MTKVTSLLTDQDLHLFNEGTHLDLSHKLGAHLIPGKTTGAYFAVWAPDAERVSVVGDFNHWDPTAAPLQPRGSSGIWEGVATNAGHGAIYKYDIHSRYAGYHVDKADPFAFHTELPPRTGSVIWNLDYVWNDDRWLANRSKANALSAPISIYEVHLGSWRRVPEEGDRPLKCRELADHLIPHITYMGFTHVEFLPIMEHPFYGSWGYQTVSYFSPSSRYGTPQDFKYLIDRLHQAGIGVILDWVPSHFPTDEHGLGFFDGTHLYEHADRRTGYHPDWHSFIFNYSRNEVRSFLLSNAMFWFDEYHADALRVDAVASMLYLDYSRKPGEWLPNEYGGRENLAAITFLRRLNEESYRRQPDIQTMAEESTAWPMVSRPAHLGGLGFGAKWDMGWMHDTLDYIQKDPLFRRYHHRLLTFRMLYAYNENFVLPISHDEVVYGKKSLLEKMPGDEWQKFANLRVLVGYMYAQAGKKLLFMGCEFGQRAEWHHDSSLEWHLLQQGPHLGVLQWVKDINRTYAAEPALYRKDFDPSGFEWIDADDSDSSVISFMRHGDSSEDTVVVVCNFTPLPRTDYRIGVPNGGFWREMLNSDAREYGGMGYGNLGGVEAAASPYHHRSHSLSLTLPPLAAVYLKR
jgi:1,4-alpha-glucan branching enzyme